MSARINFERGYSQKVDTDSNLFKGPGNTFSIKVSSVHKYQFIDSSILKWLHSVVTLNYIQASPHLLDGFMTIAPSKSENY